LSKKNKLKCPICHEETILRFPYRDCDKCGISFVYIWNVLYYWNTKLHKWELFYNKNYNPSKRTNREIIELSEKYPNK